MSERIKDQTRSGLYWSAASNLANQGMRFLFGLILARLLSPDAYGVIGMLGVFICIIGVFIDCGFSQALISKKDRTQTDFSTEFFFNLVVGVVGYALLYVLSPYIAAFYDMPILSPVLKVIGIGVVINSLCVVQSAQFSIKLDFKTPAKIGVYTQLLTGIVGISMAYAGWGVWALVFQQIGGNIFNAVLLWRLAGWRPTMAFSIDSFRYLWRYGSKILGASLIQQVYDNLYPMVIGKSFSARSLGLYSRAQGFAALPSTNFSGIVGNVTFPVMCKISDDLPRLISVYRKMLRSTSYVVFPMMLGLCALASPVVKILLNEQWYECVPLLQLLCCALIWQPLSNIHLNLLRAVGRTDLVFKLEVWKRGMGLVSIFASIPFGVEGMCIGFDIFYIYCFTLNTYYTSKALGLAVLSQFRDVFLVLLNAGIMSCVSLACVSFFDDKYVQLVAGVSMGIVYYFLTSRLFFRQIMDEMFSLLKLKR